jgi:hypothetical protein
MRVRPKRSLVVASLLVLGTSACGGDGGSEPSPSLGTSGSKSPLLAVTEADFDRADFGDPTAIDNPWFPLVPGTKLVYRGGVDDDGERLSHSVVFIVTDLVKEIDGVPTVVVWDRDYTEGRLSEGELAFFAQDDGGNVWSMGEYPEEWDDGEFVGAPDTWIVGLAGATAGVAMRANPAVGTTSYFQGLAPDIEFADRAKVYRAGQHTCVPFGCYDDVLVTSEWNPDEPGAFQRKFYAMGVGNVRVGFAGPAEKEHETLALVDAVALGPEELAQVREQALQLEARGYSESAGVYGQTQLAG